MNLDKNSYMLHKYLKDRNNILSDELDTDK